MTLDCPHCDADIDCPAWEVGPYQCPACKGWSEQDSDYIGEDSWGFWLVACDQPAKRASPWGDIDL